MSGDLMILKELRIAQELRIQKKIIKNQSLFDAYSECIRLRIDTIRANGHAKLTVYEWFMRGL